MDSSLNTLGAIFMAGSWILVLGLNLYTFYKILYNKKNEN